MRRLFAIVLSLCALTAACGGKGNPTEPSSSTGPSSSSSSSGPASPGVSGPGPGNPGNAEAEVEGLVESLPPTTPALTFKAAGRTIVTTASTTFKDGSVTRTFADLRIGMRVHVKGTASGDAVAARQVEMQNDRVDAPVEVNGVIDSLSGAAAAFQFKIGSRLVKGDATTAFFGHGDNPDSFADLKNGVRVEVKGQQRDGFVQAIRIHIEDENEDDDDNPPPQPPQNPEASIDGRLNAMAGAVPGLTLTVNTTTVRTSSATTVKRRGDPLTLAALQVGQTLEVEGTRRSDGSIDARKITIEDDDDDENEDNEVELEGTMSGLTGTCPGLSFSVNSRAITTNAGTEFDKGPCSAFRNGDRVQVKGRAQTGGSVLATRLRKKN